MDQKPESDSRKKRIDDLLLMIGGLEESIRESMVQQDWNFVNTLKKLKQPYYERLKRAAYGLPEKADLPSDE